MTGAATWKIHLTSSVAVLSHRVSQSAKIERHQESKIKEFGQLGWTTDAFLSHQKPRLSWSGFEKKFPPVFAFISPQL